MAVVEEFDPQVPSASASSGVSPPAASIWEAREDEPDYARLRGIADKTTNVYEQPIDLIDLVQDTVEREQSLYINGNAAVGDNANRNKQHAFYFSADNCIGCHACESACAEKNETPAHLAFRSVGYVEGGSYPDFQRMNISMACNHCDDPVCLKGCPTNAYTKHTEYGAVLQDPDTCFGCGYCTWVCPYNAPQLDPVKGQVSKCNMCVDRLEVGLKPACVSACVGNALDFGVVEDVPPHRDQAETQIPGFPDPQISRPNIRFERKKGLPKILSRTDSAPIKYEQVDNSRAYRPALDAKHGQEKQWGFYALSSKENPLLVFTLLTQAAVGAFVPTFIGATLGVPAMQALYKSSFFIALPILCFIFTAIGLLMSTLHLGKPIRFYRGFNNLRYSAVSREGFGVAVFMASLALMVLALLPANDFVNSWLQSSAGMHLGGLTGSLQAGFVVVSGVLATAGALAGLYYMVRCYLIPARPFWNHWQTATSFAGVALSLGALIAGALAYLASVPELSVFAWLVCFGLVLEAIGLLAHARRNKAAASEAVASHYLQTTRFAYSYWLRNGLLFLAILLCLVLLAIDTSFALLAWGTVAAMAVFTSVVGRALFYVLVLPTTMPGAFFWRNEGFAQHARETGLVEATEAGIVPNSAH